MNEAGFKYLSDRSVVRYPTDMTLVNRIALVGCIVFFSGSVVVVAARNLRDKLTPITEKDLPRAQKLIEALRGDELFKTQAVYHPTPNAPTRRTGSYLPDYDKEMIKRFLKGVIGGFVDGGASEKTADQQDGSEEKGAKEDAK